MFSLCAYCSLYIDVFTRMYVSYAPYVCVYVAYEHYTHVCVISSSFVMNHRQTNCTFKLLYFRHIHLLLELTLLFSLKYMKEKMCERHTNAITLFFVPCSGLSFSLFLLLHHHQNAKKKHFCRIKLTALPCICSNE